MWFGQRVFFDELQAVYQAVFKAWIVDFEPPGGPFIGAPHDEWTDREGDRGERREYK